MEEERSAPRIRISFKSILPFLLFIFLMFILLISSSLTGRPPEVENIKPKIAEPGDELVITGKFFGLSRNGGQVVVEDVSPPSSYYLEWTDRRISLVIPDEMSGGLLRVVTKHGESKEVVPFTNKRTMPIVLSGPIRPGEPYIDHIEPKSGSVGTTVTITGLNFGLKRGDSRISFAWISGNSKSNLDTSGLVSANDYNYDYIAWSDREIKVRVPDGSSSGSLRITTDKGTSNSVYFEVKDRAGTKLFGSRRIFHIQYSIDINNINARPDNGLYLWVPRVLEGAEQGELKLISSEPPAMFDNYRGFMLFFLKDLETGGRYRISLDFIFSRYTVETKINTARLRSDYNKTTKLYRSYMAPNAIVPSAEKQIVALSKAVIKSERNPYKKAWLIFCHLLSRLSYTREPEDHDILKALDTGKGDAYLYATLFCALTRSAGIPSRPVAGYIVTNNGDCIRHYWAEFYLDEVGWVPSDPVLGDGVKFGDFPMQVDARAYYFGNMDNRHIAMSKGVVVLEKMNPKGRPVTVKGIASLQTIHEEYIGNLISYSSRWSDLKLIGAY